MPKNSQKNKAQPLDDAALMEDILERGVVDIIGREQFKKRLKSGERIRVYLGVDPTGPQIHVGHASILWKLRQLQDLGHEVILLIGDFTARIGDPTDKEAARVTMTKEEVAENAASYKEQASKILDFSRKHPNPARLEFNSKWLDKMSFQDVMELAANFTVQQMMERDMFEKRMKEERPIYVHEFFYPMMQGWDSVAMDVDMEVGGNDQLFNMLAGRTLQKLENDKEKFVMTFEFLEGTDGRKMSKSYGNIIGVTDEPADMYGKVMALDDELIPRYWWLALRATKEVVAAIEKRIASGENPRDLKMELGRELVSLYHSEKEADEAEQAFVQVFQEKGRPDEMGVHEISAFETSLVDMVVEVGFATSKSDARRKIEQGGVRLNDEKQIDPEKEVVVPKGEEVILQVGKRNFVRIVAAK